MNKLSVEEDDDDYETTVSATNLNNKLQCTLRRIMHERSVAKLWNTNKSDAENYIVTVCSIITPEQKLEYQRH